MYHFQPATGNFNLQFRFRDAAVTPFTADSVAAGVATLNRWTHIAATYDGSQVRFYINGGTPPLTTFNRGESAAQGIQPLRLGLNIDNLAERFVGILDEMKIFSKTLQDNDVFNEYNDLKPAGNPGDPAWQC